MPFALFVTVAVSPFIVAVVRGFANTKPEFAASVTDAVYATPPAKLPDASNEGDHDTPPLMLKFGDGVVIVAVPTGVALVTGAVTVIAAVVISDPTLPNARLFVPTMKMSRAGLSLEKRESEAIAPAPVAKMVLGVGAVAWVTPTVDNGFIAAAMAIILSAVPEVRWTFEAAPSRLPAAPCLFPVMLITPVPSESVGGAAESVTFIPAPVPVAVLFVMLPALIFS